MELTIPYPPSTNRYYRNVADRTLISRAGRVYRDTVVAILRAARIKPLPGPLAIHVELYPPDRRKRDVDNALKAIGDSLQHGGAFHDDSQIVWLLVEKAEVVPGGKVIVRIAERNGKLLPFPMTGPPPNLN
ncbi:MAG: RusA family crossover junction endodeoxyribonuclease [Phycisphaerae bacterium]|nr:RusA family crossover junction endodeoxyribonuclease [Phycisphaerae bacterium]